MSGHRYARGDLDALDAIETNPWVTRHDLEDNVLAALDVTEADRLHGRMPMVPESAVEDAMDALWEAVARSVDAGDANQAGVYAAAWLELHRSLEDGRRKGTRQTEGTPRDPWMTPRETAAYIGVSVETVRGWRRKRTGPAFTRVGYRTVRYRRSDIDRWMASRKETE